MAGWVPINGYPGDQRYDDVPGTRTRSYWGEIGTFDDRWSWNIMFTDEDGSSGDEDGGSCATETQAKAVVETWRPQKTVPELLAESEAALIRAKAAVGRCSDILERQRRERLEWDRLPWWRKLFEF